MSTVEDFDSIVQSFPQLFDQLLSSTSYNFGSLTNKSVKTIMGRTTPIHGVYLISNQDDEPIYVGRSRNMAVRLGTDHRAKEKSQANLTYKIAKETGLTPLEVRQFMFENFSVKMIEVENDHARTLFEVYVAMKLNTPYNSFRET